MHAYLRVLFKATINGAVPAEANATVLWVTWVHSKVHNPSNIKPAEALEIKILFSDSNSLGIKTTGPKSKLQEIIYMGSADKVTAWKRKKIIQIYWYACTLGQVTVNHYKITNESIFCANGNRCFGQGQEKRMKLWSHGRWAVVSIKRSSVCGTSSNDTSNKFGGITGTFSHHSFIFLWLINNETELVGSLTPWSKHWYANNEQICAQEGTVCAINAYGLILVYQLVNGRRV